MQVTGDRLQLTVGRGLAKCAAEKKLCVLFIWLAQFFRLSYSNFMAKGRFMGTKVQIFSIFFSFLVRSCSYLLARGLHLLAVDVDSYPAGAALCHDVKFVAKMA